MCAMIYRHGPSLPSLISAGVVCFGGILITGSFYKRELAGEGGSEQVMMAACLTIILTGALLIMAFARYQYTHLWKTKPHGSKKHKKPHARKGRSRR